MKDDADSQYKNKALILLLGTPCPLCAASSHVRVGNFDSEIVKKIKQDFLRWTPEAGACEQCIELYTPRRLI